MFRFAASAASALRLRLQICGGFDFAVSASRLSLRGSASSFRLRGFGFERHRVCMSVIAGAVIFAAAVISVGAIWMLVVIGFGDAAVTVEVDVMCNVR